jgi:hypothetical protein
MYLGTDNGVEADWAVELIAFDLLGLVGILISQPLCVWLLRKSIQQIKDNNTSQRC